MNLESNLFTKALNIVKKIKDAGYEAYFAGGCVRDMIMGFSPQDIDIATSATPDVIKSLFPKSLLVGAKFGVVIVVDGNKQFEVTTFRQDEGYSNGRHPDRIKFTNAKEDVLRRDFTINGLLFDPINKKVIDYVGGQEDIKNKKIRAINDPYLRFEEDKLRMIRAVRFSVKLKFEIEENTYKAIKEKAESIKSVSKERIRDEFLKLLLCDKPSDGINLLIDLGLMKHIIPEIELMKGVIQPPKFHPEGDVFTHTMIMLDMAQTTSTTLLLGILLHDIGKPFTFTIKDRIRFDNHDKKGVEIALKTCKNLRLSNEDTQKIVELIENHLKFINVENMRINKLKRFLRMDNFAEHLELHRLDCLASHGDLNTYNFCLKKLEEFGEEKIKPKPLINGNDLISLGYKPGPIFKKIITFIEDLQLEDKISNKEEAIKTIIKYFPQNS